MPASGTAKTLPAVCPAQRKGYVHVQTPEREHLGTERMTEAPQPGSAFHTSCMYCSQEYKPARAQTLGKLKPTEAFSEHASGSQRPVPAPTPARDSETDATVSGVIAPSPKPGVRTDTEE